MNAMDTPIDSATQRRRKLRRMAPVFGFAVVGVAALVLLTGWLRPSVKRDHIRTAFVKKGEVSATLDASGLVVPRFEQTLTAPLATRVVRVLRTNGAEVGRGEPIVVLDDTDARREVDRIVEQIALKDNSRRKTNLELERSENDLAARHAVKELELQSYKFELNRNKTMFERGLIVEDEIRLSETAVERTTIELRHLETQLSNSEQDLAARH